MGLQDLFNWREKTAAQTNASMPAMAEDDLAADVDEPPEPQTEKFHKATIHFETPRQESLLTQALKHNDADVSKPTTTTNTHIGAELSRRRSLMSNASLASTAELTSDGGLTSPTRSNTPSPPPPSVRYSSFAPYSLGPKPALAQPISLTSQQNKETADVLNISPKTSAPAEVAPKKRCISFACGVNATKPAKVAQPTPVVSHAPAVTEAPKRKCTIKWGCPAKPSEKQPEMSKVKIPEPSKSPEVTKRTTSRSPSTTRKPRPAPAAKITHRESSATIRRDSQSPATIRAKPKFIHADEKTIEASEANRFHEFASDVVQEDDWIRKGSEDHSKKITISDTLRKENAIRLLGNEAEAEALEEDEDEEEEENNETSFEDDDDDDDNDSEDGSDYSDGNETDNEAGFADSDDGSDDGELAFWTPGRNITTIGRSVEVSTYRASAHRTASASSIDSLVHMSPIRQQTKRLRPKPIKIRPGTPDLPDSTDFVCGTLDEDRPLEDAYLSCIKARRNAKHNQTPQDIDPSFPTSDIEDEEDEEDILEPAHDSGDHAWHQGKFEDSDSERHGRRRSSTVIRRKSPGQSPKPKRLHSPPPRRALYSPPPVKSRLRSPPPRKLFGGQSPRRTTASPTRAISSPPGSPTLHSTSVAIAFAPLGSRPGLTHTKSLPRTPNAFCRAYNASRLIAANGNNDDENNDAHIRGAIDIVKGLEQKRQRRKEKFYQKHCNRKGKAAERKPQPGKGAERMRELGLLMAGKTGHNDPYMMSA